eukprot:2552145-Rhodomonas_salina.2
MGNSTCGVIPSQFRLKIFCKIKFDKRSDTTPGDSETNWTTEVASFHAGQHTLSSPALSVAIAFTFACPPPNQMRKNASLGQTTGILVFEGLSQTTVLECH